MISDAFRRKRLQLPGVKTQTRLGFPSGRALHAAHPGMSPSRLGDGRSAAAPQEAPRPAASLRPGPHAVPEPGQRGGGARRSAPVPSKRRHARGRMRRRSGGGASESHPPPFFFSQISAMLLFVKRYKEEVLGVGEVALPGEGGALREAAAQRAAKEPREGPAGDPANGTHEEGAKTERVSPESLGSSKGARLDLMPPSPPPALPRLPGRALRGESGRLRPAGGLPQRPVASRLLRVLGLRSGIGGPGLLLGRSEAVLRTPLLRERLAPVRRLRRGQLCSARPSFDAMV